MNDGDHPTLADTQQLLPDAVLLPIDTGTKKPIRSKYAGYIDRQAAQVERFQRLEGEPIPHTFDHHAIPQLRHEAKEKLHTIRPASLGQASRIRGIHPADLAVLLLYLDEPRRHPTSSNDQE